MNNDYRAKFDIREELKLIPRGVVVLAALAFVGIQALLLLVVFAHGRHGVPPFPVPAMVSLPAGAVLAFLILLVGYVNRDAKRRGMNYAAWTFLVIFIPNAIGFIIYFVVRQPIQIPCPQCGATVNPSFNFCPQCKFNLQPACPQCQRAVQPGATYCPYCSAELKR